MVLIQMLKIDQINTNNFTGSYIKCTLATNNLFFFNKNKKEDPVKRRGEGKSL